MIGTSNISSADAKKFGLLNSGKRTMKSKTQNRLLNVSRTIMHRSNCTEGI